MPSEALSLALAASIYPPALAAVIALGRGHDVRLRVIVFVLAAYATALVGGAVVLLLFDEAGTTSTLVRSPSAGLYIAAGVALLALAAYLRRPRPPRHDEDERGPSKVDRYLESRWRVALLAVVLYVMPSPILVGAIKVIADTHASTATELAYVALALVVMLWLIEVPMLVLLAFPRGGLRLLEDVNAWFIRRGRTIAVLAAALVGAYLLGVGIVEVAG